VNGKLLPIGLFGRLCRLSVKQLRHYDEVGLLRPARVDEATGYRYYRRDQVRDAMAIALLRGLDVPLAAIGEALTGGDEARAGVLRAEQYRLEAQIAAQRRAWQALDRLLANGLLTQEVTVCREPARRLLVSDTVCIPEEIGMATGRCIGQLMAAVRGVSWTPPLWGLFPVDLPDQIHVAVGVQSDGSADGLAVEHLPAGPAAVATHVGPYEQLALIYYAIFAWIHERSLRPCGTVREAYLTDPGTTDPAQLATRIVVPIEEE
jgi:DNA-binding transcriptional MerR regulator